MSIIVSISKQIGGFMIYRNNQRRTPSSICVIPFIYNHLRLIESPPPILQYHIISYYILRSCNFPNSLSCLLILISDSLISIPAARWDSMNAARLRILSFILARFSACFWSFFLLIFLDDESDAL